MAIIFILILISVVVAGGFLFVFFWAADNGQFDDLYTPSVRMLFDETHVGADQAISLDESEEARTMPSKTISGKEKQ